MKKIIFLLIFVLSLCLTAQEIDDSIEFEFYEDSLTIRHNGVWRNCAASYSLEFNLIDSTLYLMENDTSPEWANCMCYFDLSVTIMTPPSGTYSLVIHTTNKFIGDTSLVVDTSFTVANVPLISFSNPGCMTGTKQEIDLKIPLIDHYESDCQNSSYVDLYTYSYGDNVLITWYADSVNPNIMPKWNALLSNDTLHLSMLDTGAVEDSVCSKYMTAMFGPTPPGKYILNFLNGELGYPKFIINEKVVLHVEDSDLILNWDIAELNCCLETLWDGYLAGDTFHVTMTDTGAPCDCICPFELTARFGPFEPGEYILDFHNTQLGLFDFAFGGTKNKTTLAVLSTFQSECYNAVETEPAAELPADYALLSCYPNPFNPIATIKYYLPKQADIQLQVFDINGQHIETLANRPQTAGAYSCQWDASKYSSGIYFIVLTGQNISISKKMLLLK